MWTEGTLVSPANLIPSLRQLHAAARVQRKHGGLDVAVRAAGIGGPLPRPGGPMRHTTGPSWARYLFAPKKKSETERIAVATQNDQSIKFGSVQGSS